MFSIYMYNLLITGHSYKGCSLNNSEKKISPSINLASQHLSIVVLNSMCSVGETTTQSLEHHVCKVSKLADYVQCGSEMQRNEWHFADILRMPLCSYLFIIFFHFYEKSYWFQCLKINFHGMWASLRIHLITAFQVKLCWNEQIP